jgi:lipoyl(octanoyl) transferase
MNKTIQLQDLGNKDYKETWEYQEELFKGIVDLKIRNRREELTLATPNYLCLWNILMFIGKSGDLSNLLLSEKQLEEKVLRSTN